MPGGRPSKLTPEVKRKLLSALRGSNGYEPACAFAGIHYGTFRNWMAKGEAAKSGEFFEFFKDVQEALAIGEISAAAEVRQAGKQDWKALMAILERRHPERWSLTQKLRVIQEEHIESILDKLEAALPEDTFATVLRVLSSEGE